MTVQGSLFDVPEGRSTVSQGRSLSRDTAARVIDDKGTERCAACYSRVSAFGRCPRCARIGARALELSPTACVECGDDAPFAARRHDDDCKWSAR